MNGSGVKGCSGVGEKCDSGSENLFRNKKYHCKSMSWVFHHFQKWGGCTFVTDVCWTYLTDRCPVWTRGLLG